MAHVLQLWKAFSEKKLMGLHTPRSAISSVRCFIMNISGEIAASIALRSVLRPSASCAFSSDTLWSRMNRNSGGAFLQGNGSAFSKMGGRSPCNPELCFGGNDNDCGSAEFALLADHRSGGFGTGLVGLGGISRSEDLGVGASGGGRVGIGGIDLEDVDECDRCDSDGGPGGGGTGLDGGGGTCSESPLACICNTRGDGADSDTGADDEM